MPCTLCTEEHAASVSELVIKTAGSSEIPIPEDINPSPYGNLKFHTISLVYTCMVIRWYLYARTEVPTAVPIKILDFLI